MDGDGMLPISWKLVYSPTSSLTPRPSLRW